MDIASQRNIDKLWKQSANLRNPYRNMALCELARELWMNGNSTDALAVSGELLDLLKEQKGTDLWVEAVRLRSLALRDTKQYKEAIELIKEGEPYLSAGTHSLDIAYTFSALAQCHEALGNLDEQIAALKLTAIQFELVDYKRAHADALVNLAQLQYVKFELEESCSNIKRALSIYEEIGCLPDLVVHAKYRLAGTLRKLGRFAEAKQSAEDGIKIAEALGNKRGQFECQLELAQIEAATGNLELAKSILGDVAQQAQEAEEQIVIAKSHYFSSKVYLAMGDLDNAVIGLSYAIPLLKTFNEEALFKSATLDLIHLKA